MLAIEKIIQSAKNHSFFHQWKEMKDSEIQIIQTHASILLIAKDLVFKIKKEVDFHFLDFSSREKRIHAATEEIRLNRRLSPDIYLGLLGYNLNGSELPVLGTEWNPNWDENPDWEPVVVMKRLDENASWKEILKTRPPQDVELDRIIDSLNPFYQKADLHRDKNHFDKFQKSLLENIDFPMDYPFHSYLRSAIEISLKNNQQFINHRVANDVLRDCHGDLHLEHIYWDRNKKPVFIDCIEFNPNFRLIDPLEDIAFLAMDLDFQGFHSESGNLMQNYFHKIDSQLVSPGSNKNEESLSLLGLFKLYRALVRFKVNHLRSEETEIPEEEKKKSIHLKKEYYKLAIQYILQGSYLEKTAICMMGNIASGKSTMAEEISNITGYKFYSSDAIRKELAGLPIHGRPPEEKIQEIYQPEFTQKTYNQMYNLAIQESKKGHSVILDATFAKREFRKLAVDRLKDRFSRILFLEPIVNESTILDRLRERDQDKNSISDARESEYQKLKNQFEPWTREEEEFFESKKSNVDVHYLGLFANTED